MNPRLLLIPATFVLAALNTAQSPQEAVSIERPRWAAPELDRAVSVRNGRTGEVMTFSVLLDVLAKADAVFIGESHIDETTHRVELGVFKGLAARRSGKVVLAMEMFERDAQPALDRSLSGKSSEKEFLATSRPWGNYDTGYRPLVEFAKAKGLPVVGSNFPRSLRRLLAMMGKGATLDRLEGKVRALAPKKLFANSPAYWRRVDNAIRGHIGMMGVDRNDTKRLYSTQSLWDNSMGEACAIALDAHPGSSVLHVNGGFHSAYWDGTVRQLRLRKPKAKILTVSVVSSSHPAVSDHKGAPVADYLVYAEARATDLNEGTRSVYVQQEIKYRLHLPKQARDGKTVPLLIWLGDDGFVAKDGISLWRRRLGDECAIAVVRAPYRETQDDLVEGGRWFWPDSFPSDLDNMEVATDKIWANLLRHYPIDPARVCIAGEGTGATVVSAMSLSGKRIDARAVAFAPRRYAKLKDIPLPLPEFRGKGPHPKKSLRLFLAPPDRAWWSGELAEYKSIGFQSEIVAETKDAWLLETERENALRAALGLDIVRPAADATRRHLVATSPRARLWARLLGTVTAKKDGSLVAVLDKAPSKGKSTEIDTQVRPGDIVKSGRVPRCPGPFGGTTVLVLPKSTSPGVAEAWRAIEANDPLKRRSRFHRLRVATVDGASALPKVLEELSKKGRKNVLIVPAVFCADGELMRALRRACGLKRTV